MGIVLSIVFALLLGAAIVALLPIARPPMAGYAFTIGFPAGELSGQLCAVTIAVMIGAGLAGWPSGAGGAVALCLGVASALSYAWLFTGGLRAEAVVRQSLRDARGVPARDLAAAPPRGWLRWWRTCMGAPLAGRSIRVVRDLRYADDDSRAHLLDVIAPRAGVHGAPVMLYVHGGAWTIGSKRGQALPMLYELASRGWVCVSINYRLSPKATWPDHIVDVKRAIAWIRAHAAEHGGDPGRFLAISGGSAGGHLAALAALTPSDTQWQPGFEDADTSVDACVSLYGVLEMTGDLAMSGHLGRTLVALLERTVMKVPLATSRAAYEAASPLHRLHAGAPAFMVLHGTKDTLVHVGIARAFVAAFRDVAPAPLCYVELPGAQHAFDLLTSPRSTATTRGIASYLEALVASRHESAAS